MMAWIVQHWSIAAFWQLVAFAGMLVFVAYMAHLQNTPQNGINFFEMIYEPNTARINPERAGYTVCLIATTFGYVFGCTRPTATAGDIATLTATYGGLWVAGLASKRFADRPPAPLAPVQPSQGATVNVNQPPAVAVPVAVPAAPIAPVVAVPPTE